MRPFTGHFAAVAMLLASAAAAQEPQPAGDRPPAEPKAAAQPTPAQAPSSEGETWIDERHRQLEQQLTDLTELIDGIFGEDRRFDLERPGTYLRWRNELRIDDRRKWTPRTSVRASLQLPGFKRWIKSLQLVFSGESKGDPVIRRLEDPGNPGVSPSIRAEQANLELRSDFFRTPATVLQGAIGFRLRFPFEYFGALRFRRRLDLGWKVTSRLTQEGFWTNRESFGEKTQLDFDRPVAAHTQVRWNNAGFVTGVSRGYEWATEAGVAQDFPPLRTAAYLAFAVSGFGVVPKAQVELYRLFIRLRRDVWRRWLFLELEPEIGWPTSPELGRHKVHAITVRLDIMLDGRTPPGGPGTRPAPPPGPPPPGAPPPVAPPPGAPKPGAPAR